MRSAGSVAVKLLVPEIFDPHYTAMFETTDRLVMGWKKW